MTDESAGGWYREQIHPVSGLRAGAELYDPAHGYFQAHLTRDQDEDDAPAWATLTVFSDGGRRAGWIGPHGAEWRLTARGDLGEVSGLVAPDFETALRTVARMHRPVTAQS